MVILRDEKRRNEYCRKMAARTGWTAAEMRQIFRACGNSTAMCGVILTGAPLIGLTALDDVLAYAREAMGLATETVIAPHDEPDV
jgi:hypothetical protein